MGRLSEVLAFPPKQFHGERPAKANIVAALERAARRIGENDMGVFYFAGHGRLVGDTLYLLPNDAQSPGADGRCATDSLLSLAEVAAAFEAGAVRRGLLILDCCQVRAETADTALATVSAARLG